MTTPVLNLISVKMEDDKNNFLSFKLNDKFISKYENLKVPFGWVDAGGNSLGELVFIDKYSRKLEDGTKERWHQVCRRVIEGMYSIQKDWAKEHVLPWNDNKAQRSAEEAYDLLFQFKWGPPGRGLWAMGTYVVNGMKDSIALQNCGAISTIDMTKQDPSFPFCFLMSVSMLGVGIGYDCRGSEKEFTIYRPLSDVEVFKVPDSRQGWVEALKRKINSYLVENRRTVELDTSLIREKGAPIKTFGGVAPGPGPLIKLMEQIDRILGNREGELFNTKDINDLANLIGVCVVSGNVRRSALLSYGDINDKQFINLKNSEMFPDRNSYDPENPGWAWMSNNSVRVNTGDDLSSIIDGVSHNGEPGIIWEDVVKSYGRLADPPDHKDHRFASFNPCAEQPLESGEMCTLSDIHLSRIKDLKEFHRVIKYAYLYAKTVTLLPTSIQKTNAIMQRNRRIGISLSGIADFVDNNGRALIREYFDTGYKTIKDYDAIYSEWLCVRESIKVTTVKPTGCRPGEALTVMNSGIYTLEELGKKAISSEDPSWSKLENMYATESGIAGKFFRNGVAEVFKITTSYGLELESTGNHPWFVSGYHNGHKLAKGVRKEKPGWRATTDLVPGDVIETKSGVYSKETEFTFSKLDLSNKHFNEHSIKQPSHMTEDLAWMLGYFWGDGSWSPSKYRIRFSDEHLFNLERVQEIMHTHFGIKADIIAQKSKKCFELAFASHQLFDWFIEQGLVKNTTNGIPPIPVAIRTSSYKSVLAFMAGLSDSDGGVYAKGKARSLTITTADERFASEVQNVAFAAGVLFGRSHQPKGESMQKTRSMWYLTLAGVGVVPERLHALARNSNKAQLLHVEREWHPEANLRSNTLILGKIKSVVPTGHKETFDVEVYDTHWFWAGGFKSHNTTGLVVGESPGVHWTPGGKYFNRAMRLSVINPIVSLLKNAGYTIEPASEDPENTVVAYFPIHSAAQRSEKDVSIYEKIALAVEAQKWWSDNGVSVTVSFDAETEKHDVKRVLEMYDGQLKAVSFLPQGNTVYPQQPYTSINSFEYNNATKILSPVDLSILYDGDQGLDAEGESGCTTDVCEVKTYTKG